MKTYFNDDVQIFDIVNIVTIGFNISQIGRVEKGGRILRSRKDIMKDDTDDIPLTLFGYTIDVIKEKKYIRIYRRKVLKYKLIMEIW